MYLETTPTTEEITAQELACAQLALPTDPGERARALAGLRQMRVEIERQMVQMEDSESEVHEDSTEPEERIASAPTPTPLFRDDESDRPRWLPSMTAAVNAANAWLDPRPPTLALQAGGTVTLVRTPRQAARERRHLTWLVVAAIPACLLAEHTGSITGWAYHVSASWNHMWAQTQASLDEMQRIYRQLHAGG